MTVRVAVLGTGFIADMHTRAAALLKEVEVVAVAGRSSESAGKFAARNGIDRWSTDWEALTSEPDIDLVVVCTPNSLHHTQTIHALQQGRHVLVEKPMAKTMKQAETMAATAAEHERVLAVGHMWRFHSDVRALRRAIAAGELGRVVRTHGWGIHAGWGPTGWFTDPELAGGGALIDMGIHAIDTARFLLGDPHPVRVQASIGIGQYGSYDVDDDGIVLIDWSNGVRSIIECGWWQPRLGGLEADTEVLGTAGSKRIWDMQLPPASEYVHCDVPMYAAQLADVARACADGSPPTCGPEIGMVALGVVLQAYESGDASHEFKKTDSQEV